MATAWTDNGLVGDIPIKKIHIDEIRTALNAELGRRSLVGATYTDPTITSGSTTTKLPNISEIRNKIISFTPFAATNAISVGVSIRKIDITELRAKISALEIVPTYGGANTCNAACTGLCTGSCTGTTICYNDCDCDCDCHDNHSNCNCDCDACNNTCHMICDACVCE